MAYNSSLRVEACLRVTGTREPPNSVKVRGDLIIELQPGWKVNLDNPKEKVKIIRNNAVITPLVFMGNGLKPQHIYREVKATEVAPTVTHVLRIRPPNATQSLPLWELTTK